jgi:WD40 repeat protein
MSIQQRLKEAYERTPAAGAGAYDRFLRRRARSVRTVTAAAILLLALAGLAPRLLAGQDRGVVRPPRPVPASPTLITRVNAYGPLGRAVAFSSNGKTLAVAGNHRVTVWDPDRHTQTSITSPESPNGGEAVALAPDGRTLAAGAYDRVVLWDVASRTRRASLPIGTSNNVNRLAFSPDGRVLAAGDNGGKLILLDVARRTRLAILPTGIDAVSDLAFRADGRSLVVGGNSPGNSGADLGAGAAVVDVAGRRSLPALRIPGSWASVVAVAFRPDGTALAALGGFQHDSVVWDVTHRARLATLATQSQVLGVVLSRTGELLVATGPGGEVTLWDVGRQVRLGPLSGFHPRQGFGLSHRPARSPTTAGGSRSPMAPAASSSGARRIPRIPRGEYWIGLLGLGCRRETDGPACRRDESARCGVRRTGRCHGGFGRRSPHPGWP